MNQANNMPQSAPVIPEQPGPTNTSGMGRGHPLPEGVQGWSWGAFFLSIIWAVFNRAWIGLLVLLPYVGIGVYIWMCIKGREWAWQNKRWDSVEEFNRVQRLWTMAGAAIFGGVFLLTLVVLILSVAG